MKLLLTLVFSTIFSLANASNVDDDYEDLRFLLNSDEPVDIELSQYE